MQIMYRWSLTISIIIQNECQDSDVDWKCVDQVGHHSCISMGSFDQDTDGSPIHMITNLKLFSLGHGDGVNLRVGLNHSESHTLGYIS